VNAFLRGLAYVGILGTVAWLVWRKRQGASSLLQTTTSPASSASEPAGALGSSSLPPFLGNPLHLKQGGRYRMRFTSLLVQKKDLEDLGFSRVDVFAAPAFLPADWPTALRDQASAPDEPASLLFAEATWAEPTANVDRPQGLYQVWATRG